jgi:predicted flap endonuclease-1-like 5' DNA nuclease
MSLIDTIVSALRSLTGGSTQSTDTDSHREGQVSVEHDPDTDRAAADTSTEGAVKGTDPGAPTESESDDGDSDAVAAGTDAAASTGTLVDEDAGGEPAETVGDAGGVDVDQTVEEMDAGEAESDDADEDAGEAESDDADEDAGEADEETDDSEDAAETEDGAGIDGDDTEADAADNDEPVQTIKGIGPAYAERLETVGIESVGELAAADAASVADGIDVSESRVSDWIERARDAS